MSEKKKRKASQDNEKHKGAAHVLLDYVEMFVFTVAAVILLLSFAFRLCVVSGNSMNDTLKNGEYLVVSNLFYTPKKGDIIVFHQTHDLYEDFNEPIVKRVIATGGQHVKIDYTNKKVYVSDDNVYTEDEVQDESLYATFRNPNGAWAKGFGFDEYYVEPGYLFVMGDNRNDSADSRDHERVGLVDERRVLGKVLFRVAPFTTFGKAE